jgi:transcriptional regulator with XRE-family HTH domain
MKNTRFSGMERVRLPTLGQILEDFGHPSAQQLADVLGVDRSTVSGWIRRGTAPRPAMLAMFWHTTWGRSELTCTAENEFALQAALRASLEGEIERLRRQLARVLAVADFGSANGPVFDAWTAAELLARRPASA